MRNYADQANLHARIYAMKGRLLSLRDYAVMAREQRTFAPKSSSVQDLIDAKENLFREQIAPVIALVEAYDKYTPVFLAYLRQFETHNAKVLLAKAAGKDILEQWYDISPFASLDRSLLTKNLSTDDVTSLLTNTYLGNDFKPASSYRRMQMNLDISSARNIYNASSLISDQARKEFQEMILKRIAVQMVIWSYRLRVYYHWSEKDTRLYFEKINDRLNIRAESQIHSIEEDLNQHIETLRKSSGQEPSVVDIEQHLEQIYYLWLSSIFYRDFHSIYCVIAYLWLLLIQIKNLFRIIDGRRLGFSADAILSKIICKE